MTMEVILATAFGTSVDIQNGKGGKVHESATKMLNSLLPNPAQSRVPLRLQRFIARKQAKRLYICILHIFNLGSKTLYSMTTV